MIKVLTKKAQLLRLFLYYFFYLKFLITAQKKKLTFILFWGTIYKKGGIDMAIMKWDPEKMSVQVAEIDRQHQKLVSLINDLHDAMKTGKGKDVVGKIIKELINYTKVHFATEEKYFDKFGYKDTQKHKAIHSQFVEKVLDFQEKYNNGSALLTIEIMNFLSKWLKDHIMGEDQKYVSFMHENGIK